VGEAEALLAAGELENRVEDLAVDFHRPRRQILAIEVGQEHADVLGRDPEEMSPTEGPHDPGAALSSSSVRLSQEELVVAERRGLGAALGPQVLEPGGGLLWGEA
jgi:hypothetical protein